MLTIRCTKKLLEKLKLNPCDITERNPLFSWHTNLITLHCKKAVILLNDCTRYPILLYGLKVVNFKQLDKLIADAIKIVFFAQDISPDIVEKYMAQSNQIAFTKTSDRSVIAAMNQAAEILTCYDVDKFDQQNFIQTNLSLKMSTLITKIDGDYKMPKEVLLDAMTQFANGKMPKQ
jgi:hypothetical protein